MRAYQEGAVCGGCAELPRAIAEHGDLGAAMARPRAIARPAYRHDDVRCATAKHAEEEAWRSSSKTSCPGAKSPASSSGPSTGWHSFVNSGTGPLRQVDIHISPTFCTEWLEEPDDASGGVLVAREQVESPVIAPHEAARRVLELALLHQGEAQVPADRV